MIYFTADLHIGHKNIASKASSSWPEGSGYRNFSSLEEHDKTIISNINKHVKHDDTLYILGDLTLSSKGKNIASILGQVNCDSIHFIIGNHDGFFRIHYNKGYSNGYDIYSGVYENSKSVNSEHYKSLLKIKFIGYYKELFIDQHRFISSHYPFASWNGMHKGSIHTHGHCHNTLSKQGKRIDVGLELAYELFGEYRPFSLDEIIEIANSRKIEFVDHHDENTD